MTAIGDLLGSQLRVINVGLESFALELERLGVPVLHVEWSPPAGGDPKKAALLAALSDEDDEESPPALPEGGSESPA
jgi:hypothetical protein